MNLSESLRGVVVWVGLALAACSNEAKVCVPGVTQACFGATRCEGAMSCLPDGSGFTACDCGPAPDAGTDAGVRDGGSPCTTTSQCQLSHVCISGGCVEVEGGNGALCRDERQCLPGSICGSSWNLEPACNGTCVDSSGCPGGYSCKEEPGFPHRCVPPGALGGCRNLRLDGTRDAVRDCTGPESYCSPDPTNPAVGTCVVGSACSFDPQAFCGDGESCHPVGSFGWDNTGGTVCVPNGDGGLGAPCTSVFQCGAGLGCRLNAAGAGVCLKYCAPSAAPSVACAGLRRILPDGGFGGPAYCADLFTDRFGGPLYGAYAINSINVGFCD